MNKIILYIATSKDGFIAKWTQNYLAERKGWIRTLLVLSLRALRVQKRLPAVFVDPCGAISPHPISSRRRYDRFGTSPFKSIF
jgi:hypothetical protein